MDVPSAPTQQIPSGVDEIFATFEFDNLRNGAAWSAVWLNDGQVIIEQNDTWDDGPEGRKAVKLTNRKGIPDGEYHLVLGIGGEVRLEGKIVVGTPVDETDSEVSGRLVDARTGRGIGGGIVIALKPHVSLRRFLTNRSEQDVQSSCEADGQGNFVLPEQLPKGQAYSLVCAARGYQPLTVEHALRIGPEAPENANIGNVELQPD